jgi:4,5-DOPA dioxygenase extradiol
MEKSKEGQVQKSFTRMPAIFLGHGSPMNAISDNAFTRALTSLGRRLPRPRAILCVSAHWMSEGTWVTGMSNPKTIHDFYGFPKELFEVQYPAPGNLDVAQQVTSVVLDPKIQLDREMWGFDHGTWSVLRHMYPEARIPVLQLSVYIKQPPEYHYQIGLQLRALRNQGILIVGSGNIVHNLRFIRWEEGAKPYDWAIEFDEWVKSRLKERDHRALLEEATRCSESGKLSIPTPDHYYPLLYPMGASDDQDELNFEYEEIQNGSISMRCVSWS